MNARNYKNNRIFTSHYVSINSFHNYLFRSRQNHLHPTMYLLILLLCRLSCDMEIKFTSHYVSINSRQGSRRRKVTWLFTSHYVSINSLLPLLSWLLFLHLHPTMYLLIRCCVNYARVKHYDLHPTMYLLIPLSVISIDKTGFTFTSHYVSINSRFLRPLACTLHNLHPTMYLLILLSSRALSTNML